MRDRPIRNLSLPTKRCHFSTPCSFCSVRSTFQWGRNQQNEIHMKSLMTMHGSWAKDLENSDLTWFQQLFDSIPNKSIWIPQPRLKTSETHPWEGLLMPRPHQRKKEWLVRQRLPPQSRRLRWRIRTKCWHPRPQPHGHTGDQLKHPNLLLLRGPGK